MLRRVAKATLVQDPNAITATVNYLSAVDAFMANPQAPVAAAAQLAELDVQAARAAHEGYLQAQAAYGAEMEAFVSGVDRNPQSPRSRLM